MKRDVFVETITYKLFIYSSCDRLIRSYSITNINMRQQ